MSKYIINIGSKNVIVEICELSDYYIKFQFDYSADIEGKKKLSLLQDHFNEIRSVTKSDDGSKRIFETPAGISDLSLLSWVEFLINNTKNKNQDGYDQLQAMQKRILSRLGSEQHIPASKQKKLPDISTLTPIPGDQRHKTFKGEDDKIYKFTDTAEKSELEQFSAFFAEIATCLLGPEHVAGHTRSFGDEISRGTKQDILFDFETLETAAENKTLPSKEELSRLGLSKILAWAYVFEDPDLHAGNIDKKMRLFDFDRCLCSFTCTYLGDKPDEERNIANKKYPSPIDNFKVSEEDLKSFPKIRDAKPFWWLLNENTYVKNPLLPHLEGFDEIPGVQYQAYLFFLRAFLLEREMLKKFAEAHIRNPDRRKELISLIMSRIDTIKNKLLNTDEFQLFLNQNPHEEALKEIEKYNNSLKGSKMDFAIDLNEARKTLQREFQPKRTHREILTSNVSELKKLYEEKKPKILAAEMMGVNFVNNSNSVENSIILAEKYIDKSHENRNQISTIQKTISQLKKLINNLTEEFDKELSERKLHEKSRLTEQAKELKNKIDFIHKFYGTDKNNAKRIHYASSKDNIVQDEINSLKETIKSITDRLPITYDNMEGIKQSLGHCQSSINAFSERIYKPELCPLTTVKKRKNKYDQLVNGIQEILQMKRSELKEKASPAILGLQHEWHFRNLLNKCLSMLKTLKAENNGNKNDFKLSILGTIKNYLRKSGNKTPYYRLKNIKIILSEINNARPDEEVKEKLNKYLKDEKAFFIGKLPISNLRYAIHDCIREHDLKEYLKTRAAPAA